MIKQNRHQTVVQLTAQCDGDPRTNISKHTVQWKLLDMGLCSRPLTGVPFLTKRHRQLVYSVPQNIKAGPCINGRECTAQMN